jgi:3-mercaptopyruvate sulfurtransferase SseA
MRLLFMLAVAVIGVAVLAACNSADQTAINSRTSGASAAPTPADGVRRITVSELQNMVNKNEAFIVDVRSADSYNAGHIRGARLIPLNDIDKRSGELPKDKLIVTYCS